MGTKLYVGGLSWGTDDRALRDAFEGFGDVEEATVVMDRDTGRSRGFGFVTFTDGKSGEAAIAAMDGQQFDGRNITVNEARARQPRGNAGGGYGRRSLEGGFPGTLSEARMYALSAFGPEELSEPLRTEVVRAVYGSARAHWNAGCRSRLLSSSS